MNEATDLYSSNDEGPLSPEQAMLHSTYMVDQETGESYRVVKHTQKWGATVSYNFENDEHKLSVESLQVAKEAAKAWAGVLLENPGLSLEVYGHTSSLASTDYNKSLSQNRANFTAQLIIEAAINLSSANGGTFDSSRVKGIGLEETQLLYKNDENNGELQNRNRRTEIRFSNNSDLEKQ
ncbi:OmpA family protein [Brumimicrobium mesophilum]|uniref:OmpA family protein n=1 Tax=Brumimicrobium mesophilum TaxID=392717 RepID=UPI000D144394|nr:OmpA family protein [Brumimicrobium mesophilum]